MGKNDINYQEILDNMYQNDQYQIHIKKYGEDYLDLFIAIWNVLSAQENFAQFTSNFIKNIKILSTLENKELTPKLKWMLKKERTKDEFISIGSKHANKQPTISKNASSTQSHTTHAKPRKHTASESHSKPKSRQSKSDLRGSKHRTTHKLFEPSSVTSTSDKKPSTLTFFSLKGRSSKPKPSNLYSSQDQQAPKKNKHHSKNRKRSHHHAESFSHQSLPLR